MKELFTGIYTKFSNDGDLSGVVTGMYFTEAPQDAVMPYVVFHKISGVPDHTFTEDMENVIIQFNIFDDHSSSTTVNDIYAKLTALFDWCTLTVAGWNSIYMKRELDNLTRDNDIWNYFAQFRLEIQK